MKSNSTTNSTRRIRLLTAAELCNIIEACGKAGVVELKFDDTYISFKAPDVKEEPPTATSIPCKEEEPDTNFIQDEAMLKEIALANMALENPMQYEELLAGEDLVKETGEDHDETYS